MEELLKHIENYKNELDINNEITDYLYYDSSSYICDAISEYADGSVDIYNYDLLNWAKDNYSYIEEAIDEFGDVAKDSNGRADFIRTIQQGQYLKYERDAYNQLDDVIKFEACRCLIDLLKDKETNKTIEDFDEFIENLNIDNNDRCDDIYDACEEFLEIEE